MTEQIPFGSFEDFWAALNRLYQTTVAHGEQIEKIIAVQQKTAEQIDQLVQVAAAHERRLRRLDG
jgi:hypothetical protein